MGATEPVTTSIILRAAKSTRFHWPLAVIDAHVLGRTLRFCRSLRPTQFEPPLVRLMGIPQKCPSVVQEPPNIKTLILSIPNYSNVKTQNTPLARDPKHQAIPNEYLLPADPTTFSYWYIYKDRHPSVCGPVTFVLFIPFPLEHRYPMPVVMTPSVLLVGVACGFLGLVVWNCAHAAFLSPLQKAFDNIPGPSSSSFFVGSLDKLWATDGWDWHRSVIATYREGVARVLGPLRANCLYVFDPTALHHILLKDQQYFEEADAFLVANRLLFGNGILSSVGSRHRAHRKLLAPAFSINHMRTMVPLFYQVMHKAHDTIAKKVADGQEEIDMMQWIYRISGELIGQGGLGYSFDSLQEDSATHPYIDASKRLIPAASQSPAARVVVPLAAKFGTPKFRRWLVDVIPWKVVQDVKGLVDVLHRESAMIYRLRRDAVVQGGFDVSEGKDIMSLLIRENMRTLGEDKLSESEMISQVLSLTFAATDTTSSALAHAFYVLALHKEGQTKLRQELRAARENNGGLDLDYDTLSALPYLDAVCRETLRLHPPVSIVQRSALQDVTIPVGKHIQGLNGQFLTTISIPKGTEVFISIIGTNQTTELWGEDAQEWKPERWMSPLPKTVTESKIPGIYSNQMTFLGGGRSCIGFKFSQLEMKVALALLVEKFEFSPSDQTIVWQMGQIATPHKDYACGPPSLPLRVALAK